MSYAESIHTGKGNFFRDAYLNGVSVSVTRGDDQLGIEVKPRNGVWSRHLVDLDPPPFPSSVELAEKWIYGPARKIAAELVGKNIPAASLTNEQKCALLTLAGLMKYEDGKMVSVCPVAIADRGDGTYIIGSNPDH